MIISFDQEVPLQKATWPPIVCDRRPSTSFRELLQPKCRRFPVLRIHPFSEGVGSGQPTAEEGLRCSLRICLKYMR